MQQSIVINIRYEVYYTQKFVNEVERVLNENTRDLSGTSERVTQVGFWIGNLLLFIQRLGNLADFGHYTVYDNYIGFNTNMYEEGIGELFFNVYFDKERKKYIVYVLDANWDFKNNHLYDTMYENKSKESLMKLIQEAVHEALVNIN